MTAKGKERTRATTTAVSEPDPERPRRRVLAPPGDECGDDDQGDDAERRAGPVAGRAGEDPGDGEDGAKPTAGSSQHHSRRPASEKVALPTRSEARQISAAEA